MPNARLKNIIEITTAVIFFSAFAVLLLQSIRDPDMFWHLKTGEWIWENKSLPDKDPFSFAADASPQAGESATFILKQYWLGQLMMFGFYKAGGMYGILTFRLIIFLGISAVLYLWMGDIKNSSNRLNSSNSSNGLSRMGRLLFLVPAVMLSMSWLGERPNNLSFLFSVVVVYLLEDLRVRGSRLRRVAGETEGQRVKGAEYLRCCALPFTMLLWANMHGGFLLGDALIAIYVLSESALIFLGGIRQEPRRIPYKFFLICTASILVSFINPNTYKGIYILMKVSKSESFVIPVTEFLSPFYYYGIGAYKFFVFIGIMVIPVVLRLKKIRLHAVFILLFLTTASLMSIRFIPFLVYVMTPFAAEAWADPIEKILRKTWKSGLPVIIILGVFLFLFLDSGRTTIFRAGVVARSYPEKAVQFITAVRPEPELFNDYAFGGYLIWALYPEYRVFADGRALSRSTDLNYLKTISGSQDDFAGHPAWKVILDSNRINMILVNGSNPVTGSFTRLVRRLVEDREWSLVFVDSEGLLFLRDKGRNSAIIKKHSMPKILAYEMALMQAEKFRRQFPGSRKGYTSMGEINLYLGRPGVAAEYFEYAIMLDTSLRATMLSTLVDEIESGRDYRLLMEQVFR